MIDRYRPRRSFPAPRPVGDNQKLPCSTCRGRVDPLRAARVAVFNERFHYFCSPECRVRFVPGAPPARSIEAPSEVASARPSQSLDALEPASLDALEPASLDASSFESVIGERDTGGERELGSERGAGAGPVESAESTRSGWLVAALVLAALGTAATLPQLAGAGLLRWASALSAAAACGAYLLGTSRPTRPTSAFPRVNPIIACAAALVAPLLDPAHAAAIGRVATVVVGVAAGGSLWVANKRRALGAFQRWVADALALPSASDAQLAREVAAIKPGEELVLRAGQRVHVDVVVTAGRARVEPWPGSRLRLARGEGDGLLGGATVIEGALRAMVRWVASDRAWARLSVDPARRADRHMAVARSSEWLASTGATAAGVIAGALSLWLGVAPLLSLAHATAVAAALGNAALPELIALYIARGVFQFEIRGICFRDAAAVDRAGRASSVVFCDRGTLLSGELSVASIEPSADITEDELLAWVGGAYAGVASPLANALTRSLSAQGLRPDTPRSPHHLPGLGVTAVASNGRALVAGTRALLLERRISVASAEARIAELEALGRSVLLVALDSRWVGLVAMQDGLRPGARAATQTLIDVGVEPVLLSGEARETCRALARHIGIEHVRPEVLPQDRAAEVRRLSQATGTIAVVGSSIDDAALAAAPLSINVDARGGPLERCDIDIVSGDVRDAAAAVQLARALHAETRSAGLTALAPAALGLLALLVGSPSWSLPLLGLLGSMLAGRRLQAPLEGAETSASLAARRLDDDIAARRADESP